MNFSSFYNAEISDKDMVTQWLNAAAVGQNIAERLETIHKIQEVLLRKSPELLPQFLPEVMNFITDKNADVRRALVGFIEELCKEHIYLISKVAINLHMLLCQESIPVQKRVIQALITIYKKVLTWICTATNVTSDMEEAWTQISNMKMEIVNMIDSDNDGIRTSSVKFLETVILLQTYPDPNESKKPTDFSIEDVPLTLKIARRRKLEEEAQHIYELLVKFVGSQHISSANLLACLGVLTTIAKNRPEFMMTTVATIESLHSNLPPTLTTTQVNSVRKKLKSELMGLIKHPAAFEYADTITKILTDLGCQAQEVAKLLPKLEERRKYVKRTVPFDSVQISKKPRLETQKEKTVDPAEKQKAALEANEKYVLDNLSIEKTVHLVMSGLTKVPNVMPSPFANDYVGFINSGQVGQPKVIAKLLGAQFLEIGLGPGAKIATKSPPVEKTVREVVIKTEPDDKDAKRKKMQKVKTLKLAEITKPLPKDTKEILLLSAVQKLLMSDRTGTPALREKVITTLAATFGDSVKSSILNYLLTDLRSNVNVALAWLYEEYSIMQGFARIPALRHGSRIDQSYNTLLIAFVSTSSSDAIILSRLLLEAPLITEGVLDQVCIICKDENRCGWSLGLLRDLAIRRPPKEHMFLNALLSHTTHESSVIRDCAIAHVLELHKRPNLKAAIEKFALMNLEYLRYQQPNDSLFGSNQGRLEGGNAWTDDISKACLMLYVSLMPVNESLIHDLAKVYVQTSPDIKRVILRMLEAPIRAMGMESMELLKLVEECPKGSGTLVTRVIHILTDKEPPSAMLVQRVRDLYHTRVPDVRFLIPVLNGLTKKEVIAALPKLIKLNPVVVREVFNRLLGVHGDSPITPTELLVALHLIDTSKADLKTVMKATSMCLNEKHIFTQEVLAVVLQQLMDQQQLPTLLMRTVIQALGSYPRLSGFVMNILQRLILKQVWKHKVVWEGFVKCCQRTKPQSFAVLMQLPAPQLSEALSMCQELRDPLREHLLNFTEGQRAHIPQSTQEVVLGTAKEAATSLETQPVEKEKETEELTVPPSSSTEPLPPGME